MAIDFGNLKIDVFIGSMSFDYVIDVIADDACMLFCGRRLTLLKKMYRVSGRFVCHSVSLVKDRSVY